MSALEAQPRRTGASAFRAIAAGTALFYGLFSLANAVVALRAGVTEDLWWIDLSGTPAWVSGSVWLVAAALVAYGAAPDVSALRRKITIGASGVLAVAAAWNAVGFYAAWRDGLIAPSVPLPFSALVALSFVFVGAVAARRMPPMRPSVLERVGTASVVLVLVIAFPLAHVAFFGTTDYRRQADAAVVLGAKVHADGRLSVSLEDRVRTASELYAEGLVRMLIMSGGVGESGYDETVAMRDRAIELGVPAEAIVLDNDGIDTDHTVANTVIMLEETGCGRVLVVSQFYHLPRVKMAYRAAGWQVYTVPARKSVPIGKTPLLVVREVPAFWAYWARSWVRSLTAG